jgi:hypothetical protein
VRGVLPPDQEMRVMQARHLYSSSSEPEPEPEPELDERRGKERKGEERNESVVVLSFQTGTGV